MNSVHVLIAFSQGNTVLCTFSGDIDVVAGQLPGQEAVMKAIAGAASEVKDYGGPERRAANLTNRDADVATVRAVTGAIANGVAKSWKDPEVAKARATRDKVIVTHGKKRGEFRSVREAFKLLGLPEAKHVAFRANLKSKRKDTFTWKGIVYNFEAVAV